MAKSAGMASDVLAFVFQAKTPAWFSNSEFWIGLHKGEIKRGDAQNTNEADYTNYERAPAPRGESDWSIDELGACKNAITIKFEKCLGRRNDISHVSIGTEKSGAGRVLYVGALEQKLAVSNLIRPEIEPGDLTITES